MKSIRDILQTFDPFEDKYISREFQSFGVHLAEKLNDRRHKSLYIKLARDLPRPVLEEAYRFVIDAHARNKGALFMWKLKEMGVFPAKSLRKSQKKPAKKVKSPQGQK